MRKLISLPTAIAGIRLLIGVCAKLCLFPPIATRRITDQMRKCHSADRRVCTGGEYQLPRAGRNYRVHLPSPGTRYRLLEVERFFMHGVRDDGSA